MNIFKLLKILSSESKAKMIIHFMECGCGDVSVTDICTFTCLKQANVSKHIMALREDGILDSDKRGREVIYTMNKDFKEQWGPTIKTIISTDPTLAGLKCMHKEESCGNVKGDSNE